MKRVVLLLPAAALAIAACGPDGSISVDGAWARTSPRSSTLGAVYLDVTSPTADTLLGVSVPPSIADHAEIHEVVAADTTGMGDMSSGDSDMPMDTPMAMQEMTDGLPLPAGETVSLAPGGYHIMLIDLVEPLVTGEEFEITLDLAQGDDVTVTVDVADSAP